MKDLLVDGGILFIALSIQVYIQSYILQFIFDLNFSGSRRVIFSIISGVYGSTSRLFIPINLSSLNSIIFLLITTSFLKHYNPERSLLKCLIYTIVIMILSAPIELISGWIGFQLLSMPTNTENVIGTIPVLLIMDFLYFIVAVIIYAVKKKRNIIFRFNNKSTYWNIIFAFLFLAPNIIFYTMNRYNYPFYLLLYNIFANLFLVILTIYNTYNSLQLETKKRELENAELHNKTLSTLIDNIRVFKHDYNNVVHAIGGYILLNDMEGLKKYYNGLAKDSRKVNQLEAISPTKINEPSIYGLIASKYQIADLKHLSFNFESVFDYQNLNMPIYDFCKVFGILLDNAIEAAEETEEKIINVYVRESVKDHIQLFSIENSYANKEIDTEKIFEKDYSTKHRNSGIGLWEVKNIIEKNQNVTLITSKDEKFFKQELYIQTNNKEDQNKNHA